MPTCRAGRSNSQRGFTLAELAVVVFIIALFAALTVPSLTGFGERDLSTAARRLAGTIKYLYNEAALERLPHRVVSELEGTVAGRGLPGDVRFKDIYVTGRGSFSNGTVTIEVFPVGWVEETVLHLIDGEEELTLRIAPLTGTTEVYEGYRDFRR
jgi:general secretion pathway protein H